MSSLRVRAPAKLNLGLRVLGVLNDGTTPSTTIYQAIDLFATWTALGEHGIRVSVQVSTRGGSGGRGELLPARRGSAESVGRLRRRRDPPHQAHPAWSGAGWRLVRRGGRACMGWASCWAAASTKKVDRVAAAVGADVGTSYGATAFGYHRGSHLLTLPALTDLPALVVVPAVTVSTFWRTRRGMCTRAQASKRAGHSRGQSRSRGPGAFRNDFEAIVFERFRSPGSASHSAEGQPIMGPHVRTGAACLRCTKNASHGTARPSGCTISIGASGLWYFRVRLFSGGWKRWHSPVTPVEERGPCTAARGGGRNAAKAARRFAGPLGRRQVASHQFWIWHRRFESSRPTGSAAPEAGRRCAPR